MDYDDSEGGEEYLTININELSKEKPLKEDQVNGNDFEKLLEEVVNKSE